MGKEQFEIDELPVELLDLGETDIVARVADSARRQSPGLRESEVRLRARGRSEKEAFIGELLPVLDGFERVMGMAVDAGLAARPEFRNWFKGVEAVYRRLSKVLRREGLEAVESVGQPLDLDVHEVVDVQSDSRTTERVIVAEEQKGYKIGETVLREAKVVVSQPVPIEQLNGGGVESPLMEESVTNV